MDVEVERRKKELLHTWCQALDNIETGRLKITVKHFSNFIVSPDFKLNNEFEVFVSIYLLFKILGTVGIGR